MQSLGGVKVGVKHCLKHPFEKMTPLFSHYVCDICEPSKQIAGMERYGFYVGDRVGYTWMTGYIDARMFLVKSWPGDRVSVTWVGQGRSGEYPRMLKKL